MGRLKKYAWYALVMAFCLPYVISHLIPRQTGLWVFGYGGGEGFTDNTKHLYLYASENRPEIRPIWISDDQAVVDELTNNGHEAYHSKSHLAVYYNLRAEATFVTHSLHDVLWWTTGGSTVIRLNHGIPFKQSQWANADELQRLDRLKAMFNRRIFWNYDRSVAPSKAYVPQVAEMAGVSQHQVYPTGLPRSDIFFDPEYDVHVGCNELVTNTVPRLAENHSIVFYFPTWRSNGSDRTRPFDVQAVDEVLRHHDAYLLLCKHTNSTTGRVENIESDRILTVGTSTDFYPLLLYVDVSITDYSSLFYDFLLTDCPIIYYQYDINEYIHSRDFIVNVNSLPGQKVHSKDEFNRALNAALNGEDPDEAEVRTEWTKDVFNGNFGRSCARLVNELQQSL